MTSINSKSKMSINNTTWTPADLLENYFKIKKPKFNRDKVWTIKSSDKKRRANYEEFLEFLFKTRNSVAAISLGAYLHNNEKHYVVIDGNNRINAIVCFFQCPYKVFTSLYDELFDYIDSCPDDKVNEASKIICKDAIKKLTYRELSSFTRIDYILPSELEFNRRITIDIENKLLEIQNKLSFHDNSPYDTHIK